MHRARTASVSVVAATLFALPLAAQQQALQVDWIQSPINGHWYGVDYSKRSWQEAEDMAVSLGGHLATIRSQAEQDWIVNTFWVPYGKPQIWIGLNDIVSEGNFVWASGESVGFTSWVIGEPNNAGNEDGVHLGWSITPNWNDGADSAPLACLYELGSYPELGWLRPRSVATAERPLDGQLADIEGDGDLDFICANHDAIFPSTNADSLQVFWNDGAGHFLNPLTLVTPSGPRQARAIDHDHDGDLDIVLTCNEGQSLLLFVNQGAGNMASAVELATGAQFRGLAVLDVDGDGIDDLFTTSPDSIFVLRGSPAGGFEAATPVGNWSGAFPTYATVGDLDGDGHDDVVLSVVDSDRIDVLQRDGSGSLVVVRSIAAGDAPHETATADIDGDGDLDLVQTAAFDDVVKVWTNDGSAVFTLVASYGVPSHPEGVAIDDFDRDGFPDFAIASGSGGRVTTFRGHGDATFEPWEYFDGMSDVRHIAAGDIDGDGAVDLTATVTGESRIVSWLSEYADFEPALESVLPSIGAASLATAAVLESNAVPNGPAELVLGPFVVPVSIANDTASVDVPPLGYASALDVTVDAKLRWSTPQGVVETDQLPSAFTWDVPQVASVTPNAVPFDVPSAVFIELAENVVTSGLGTVRFGSAPPAVGVWFTFGGATLVSVVSPPQLTPGVYPIELEITSGGVTEYTRVEGRALVHLGPGIVAQSAISGFQGGGDVVEFGLVDFEPGVPVEVAFGSATTSGVPTGFLAQSTLNVVTPLSPVVGVVDIALTQTQPGGGQKVAVSPDAFEFLPPVVGALTSVSGPQAGGEIVDIATSGFASGPIDVHIGGVVALGSVLGSGANQIATFATPAATAPGQSAVRLVQGVFDVTASATYEFLAPSVASVTPSDAAWYEPQSLVIHGANFAPNDSADVVIESGATLAATVVSPTEIHVDLPAEHLAGAGPLDVTVVQSTVSATASDAFTCLPSLDVTVLGSAALGGQVRFDVASRQGGFALILLAAFPSPLPITLADTHHAAYLDPATFVWLATGGLLASPTFAANFAAGKLSPGAQIPAQALVFEFGPFGARNGFTQLVTIEVP